MSRRARAAVVWTVIAAVWSVGFFTVGSVIGVRDEGFGLDGPAAGLFILGLATAFAVVIAGVFGGLAAALAWVDRGK